MTLIDQEQITGVEEDGVHITRAVERALQGYGEAEGGGSGGSDTLPRKAR